mmetsp:Transcript_11745/g.47416  ORF Transcript_11745/g.47416 Transcript_11745/m.47416 type:complete len:302 (+) Transcript_11745:2500-3405(+)
MHRHRGLRGQGEQGAERCPRPGRQGRQGLVVGRQQRQDDGRGRLQGQRHQHLSDDCLRGPAERRGQAYPLRLPRPHAAAFHEGRPRPRQQRLRRQQLPFWADSDGVLLPRHGRSRGSHRHGREDVRDRLHPASPHQGDGGCDGEVRRHRTQLDGHGRAIHLRRGWHGRHVHREAAHRRGLAQQPAAEQPVQAPHRRRQLRAAGRHRGCRAHPRRPRGEAHPHGGVQAAEEGPRHTALQDHARPARGQLLRAGQPRAPDLERAQAPRQRLGPPGRARPRVRGEGDQAPPGRGPDRHPRRGQD